MSKKRTKPSDAPQSAKPSPLDGWVEVFRAGKHTDSSGKQMAFSHDDLDQMIANHQLGAAPIVLGHPKDNDPAFGWAGGYKREGDSLFAQFDDVNPDFSSGVASGAYRNRSVSVYKDGDHGWRVRHIGFLGAMPPAIDGLQPLQFAAPEKDCFEFAMPGISLAWGLETAADCLRNLREHLIATQGVDAADKVLPNWQISSIEESATRAREELDNQPIAQTNFSKTQTKTTNTKGNVTMTPEEQLAKAQADVAAAQQAQQDAESKLAEFSKAAADSQAKLQTISKERQAERIGAQVEALVREGKVTPAQRTGMVEFMTAIEDGAVNEFNFSQGEGVAEGKKTPAQWFADFAAKLPVQVKLGQTSTAGADAADVPQEGTAIAAAASNFIAEQAKKGVVISVSEAIAHVTGKA